MRIVCLIRKLSKMNSVLVLSTIAMLTSCSGREIPCRSVDVPPQPRATEVERGASGIQLGEELLSAIEDADIVRVNFCLLAGADANYKGDSGITPLGAAVRDVNKGPNPKVVKILLKWGADPKALWGNCATTPFFSLVQNSTSGRAGSAVLSNQVACVRLLLEYGADPNRKQGLFRKSSLEYAIMREGDLELVEALVEGGAEITDEMIADAKDVEVKRYLQSTDLSMPVTR